MARQAPEEGGESLEEYSEKHENPFIPDDYEEMQASEVMEMLHGCSVTELVRIRDWEKSHQGRKSVLRAIEQHLNQ